MSDRPLSEQLDQAIDGILAGAKPTGSADQTLSALMKIAGSVTGYARRGIQDTPWQETSRRFSKENTHDCFDRNRIHCG